MRDAVALDKEALAAGASDTMPLEERLKVYAREMQRKIDKSGANVIPLGDFGTKVPSPLGTPSEVSRPAIATVKVPA